MKEILRDGFVEMWWRLRQGGLWNYKRKIVERLVEGWIR